ncbi:MAG: hypothetical protein ACPGNV_07625 [Mangrovicoccus sp.]
MTSWIRNIWTPLRKAPEQIETEAFWTLAEAGFAAPIALEPLLDRIEAVK